MNKKMIDEIFEKKKQEKDKSNVTQTANRKIFISSIFFPTQISNRLLHNVADAYIEPNCSVSLILVLNIPRKKLCPKLEKNVNINPNTITFKLKFLNIKKYDF